MKGYPKFLVRKGMYTLPFNFRPVPVPVFDLPLNDLGAGIVNLVPRSAVSPTPTFTRATIATTVGPTGLVVPVGVGVARSAYDPTNLGYLGYLSEGGRTNLFARSEEFDNAVWAKTDTVATANNTAAPDGNVTADLLTEGVLNSAGVVQSILGTANATFTTSIWIKRGNTDWVRLDIFDTVNGVRGWFNLNTGVVGSTAVFGTGTIPTVSIVAYPNGWYRCTLTGKVNNAATAINVNTSSSAADASLVRVNNATRFQWGAQFEDNITFASSYIPTTAAPVTRNADVLTYPFAGNARDTVGSAYAELTTEYITKDAVASGYAIDFSLAVGGALAINISAAATTILIYDGSTTAIATGLTDMSTGVRKRASSWGSGFMSITGDGVVPQVGAFDGSMSNTAVAVGCITSGLNQWFGTLKNVRIWNTKLSDSLLRTITSAAFNL